MFSILNSILAASNDQGFDECGRFSMEKLSEQLNRRSSTRGYDECGIYTPEVKKAMEAARRRPYGPYQKSKLHEMQERMIRDDEAAMGNEVVFGRQSLRSKHYEIYDMASCRSLKFKPNTIPCPNKCWCEAFVIEDCALCGSYGYMWIKPTAESDEDLEGIENVKTAEDLSNQQLIRVIYLLQRELMATQREVKRCHRSRKNVE